MHRISISNFVGGNLGAIRMLIVRNTTNCVVRRLHADVSSEVYFLLPRHHISLTATEHGRLDVVVHTVVIRVQMLSCVIVASWPAMAVKTFVCNEVWIERAYVGSAIGSLSS